MLARHDDPMTVALRSEGVLGIDELIHLNRALSPLPVVASSSGTLTSTVFSSRKESTGTKPTSAGTSYPVDGYKGKAVATYASSVSATHGSGSEAEAELEALRDSALVGVGDWSADPPLKGSARARKRPRVNRRPKHKKPVVIIQQEGTGSASSGDEGPAVAKQVARRNGKGTQHPRALSLQLSLVSEAKYLRQRRHQAEHDQLHLAEEGRVSEASASTPPAKPLSRARLHVLVGLVVAIVLTFALSTFAAHHTGKGRMACTKAIIFAATVLLSCFTVLAMVVARRALQEALLAGLLESLVGFALVVEIHDFM